MALKGDSVKMRDQNKRAMLIEAVIASGLIVIGIPTGQVPLLALAAAATSVGCNWTHSLAERGFQHWRDRWFTDDGVLNHDITKALCDAFVDAIRQVEHDWRQHRHYQYLQHKRPEEAKLTMDALRLLREDGANLFQRPNQLTQVIQQEQQDRVLSLLYQDEFKASECLKPALGTFFYGHDDEFVTFVAKKLGPGWILRFLEILKDSNEEGTRAWRACQLLWQKSLMIGIDQIQRTTAETADTVHWLKEWAQQLKSRPPTERNPIGQDALEEILHSVHAQLNEIQAATKRIETKLEQVYQMVAPAEIAPSHAWNVPYQPNPFFTGREELLKQLHDNLMNRKAVALTQAISGLGGIGKTQTAVEYAYRYRDEYHDVLWVNAATRDTLITSFLDLTHQLNLPEKDEQDQNITVQAMKRWLEQHDHWLLIVDNADDLSLAYDFLPAGGKGHILLTTRAQALGTLANKIDVEKMDKDEGMLFLLRRAKVLAIEAPLFQAPETDRVAAETIVKEMDGLPLALDQAGAYIEETGCSLSTYLDLYRQRRFSLLKRRGGFGSEHPDPVVATWSLSFAGVAQRSTVAADLLRLCAFLHPDAIPEELFGKGAVHLGPVLAAFATNPLAFNTAFATVSAYSLLRRNSTEKTLSFHRLVQAVLQDTMTEQERTLWIERVVMALDAVFPDSEPTTWSQCERLVPHVLICATSTQSWMSTNTDLASLLFKTAHYLVDRAQYDQAEPLYQRALLIWEQDHGPDHPLVAYSLNGLATLYREQGKYDQAEPLFQRALLIWEQAHGADHRGVAYPLDGLAILYRKQGKYDQAELLYQRAVVILEHHLGPQHPEMAEILDDFAAFHYAQGNNIHEAVSLYQRALVIREQSLGPHHPKTMDTRKRYITLLRALGRHDEAALLEVPQPEQIKTEEERKEHWAE